MRVAKVVGRLVPGLPGQKLSSASISRDPAVVKAYDVRPETREQAESLGAQFVTLKTQIDATGASGRAESAGPPNEVAGMPESSAIWPDAADIGPEHRRIRRRSRQLGRAQRWRRLQHPADVEDDHRVRQCAHGDEVHPGLGDLTDCVESNTTGSFNPRTLVDQTHRFGHLRN